jgi:tetratricopeptide (TPR) repeat protein
MKRQLTVESTPVGAEIFVLLPSGQYEKLGETPFIIEEATIKEWMKEQLDFTVLKISKSGFVSENLFLNIKDHYRLNYMAHLKAVDVWNNKEIEVSSTAANKLALKVQSINQQVFSKKFDSALNETEALIEQFPKAHVFYDIKGSILFLMGKRSEAVASYQKSLSLNPDNNEAKMMLKEVTGEKR